MIVTKLLGSVENFGAEYEKIAVKIHPDDRLKQILRLEADDGAEIGLRLESGHLHPGDVLAVEGKRLYYAQILPQDVLIISEREPAKLAFAAHSIGNRHTPAVFENGAMIIEYDRLIADFLTEHEIAHERAQMVLRHALRHASHTH